VIVLLVIKAGAIKRVTGSCNQGRSCQVGSKVCQTVTSLEAVVSFGDGSELWRRQ